MPRLTIAFLCCALPLATPAQADDCGDKKRTTTAQDLETMDDIREKTELVTQLLECVGSGGTVTSGAGGRGTTSRPAG